MRKILSLLLCFWIIIALTACNLTRNESISESASPGESAESPNLPTATERVESSPSAIPPSGNEITVTEQPSASPTESAAVETKDNIPAKNGVIPIKIAVDGAAYTATLKDNKTTQALVAQFPITIQMDELNGSEKFYHLSKDLPSESTERPATIHTGDIMIWSGNSLVLFYNTYSNSYGGYVPLGRVDDPSNLASALGSGNVQVTWSLAD